MSIGPLITFKVRCTFSVRATHRFRTTIPRTRQQHFKDVQTGRNVEHDCHISQKWRDPRLGYLDQISSIRARSILSDPRNPIINTRFLRLTESLTSGRYAHSPQNPSSDKLLCSTFLHRLPLIIFWFQPYSLLSRSYQRCTDNLKGVPLPYCA